MTKRFSWLWLFRGALVLMVVATVAQNVRVTRANADLRSNLRLRLAQKVEPGDKVHTLIGVDLEGKRITVDFATGPGPTLVLTFSSGCPACLASLPRWSRLAEVALESRVRTAVVSKAWLPAFKEFVDKGVTLPGVVIVEPNHATYLDLRMDMVPHTLVVERDGTVDRVWVGQIDQQREDEIGRYLRSLVIAEGERK